uniref:purine-nucleoside phosphorylase n=1 Tax=Anser cygnoides TaxID=8845 RepID=A0A8B9EMH5_ANSCY|nr:purine nucleoside phosphorylase-like [Anser cygnoides]
MFLTPMSFTPSSSTPMFLTPLLLHPTSSTLAVPRPESPSPKVLRPDTLAPCPQVVLPVRALRLLGVHTLVLTNAAGSLSPALGPGDLMVIKDHIDLPGLAGRGPLVGPNDERFGPRFPTMLDAYDPELRRLALAMAPPELRAREGVYAGVGGPSYETVAECRFLQRAGADAVGESGGGVGNCPKPHGSSPKPHGNSPKPMAVAPNPMEVAPNPTEVAQNP